MIVNINRIIRFCKKMENENIAEDEVHKQFIKSVKSITTITVSNIDESTKN